MLVFCLYVFVFCLYFVCILFVFVCIIRICLYGHPNGFWYKKYIHIHTIQTYTTNIRTIYERIYRQHTYAIRTIRTQPYMIFTSVYVSILYVYVCIMFVFSVYVCIFLKSDELLLQFTNYILTWRFLATNCSLHIGYFWSVLDDTTEISFPMNSCSTEQ